ncbi:MAG: YggS family pyridoxal phosphate-dependent enzyme [Bacteroidaceae bacterium]|nr:YggS family pyridoxal phosphate-dependent enzyme [Bacteroidaceae bacterium]
MIGDRIKEIKSKLPDGVDLCAVSKYHPAEMIHEAYDCGQRIFGESHVQELMKKYEILPKDIKWHFIGHLQTNKVKYIAPFVSLIHSVDTPKLLAEINRQGIKYGRRIPCLLQLHVAQEETKFGFTVDELKDYLLNGEWRNMEGIDIQGIMCMATNTDDEERILNDFRTANEFSRFCAERFGDTFRIRSWGMSGDYLLAVREGSNLVRIGSKIFGERVY